MAGVDTFWDLLINRAIELQPRSTRGALAYKLPEFTVNVLGLIFMHERR